MTPPMPYDMLTSHNRYHDIHMCYWCWCCNENRSFFQRWYEVQSVADKKRFKHLVFNGQLEFIGGGWVQNDEANPDYPAIINQVTLTTQQYYNNIASLVASVRVLIMS
jgi:hypothetical protein